MRARMTVLIASVVAVLLMTAALALVAIRGTDRGGPSQTAGNVETVPVWSYDSRRFAYVSGDTAVVVEATGTLTARSGPLPCIAKCDLKWSVEGSGLRVLQTVRSDPPSCWTRTRVRAGTPQSGQQRGLTAETGRLTWVLPVPIQRPQGPPVGCSWGAIRNWTASSQWSI
jgi:hypothetical protein